MKNIIRSVAIVSVVAAGLAFVSASFAADKTEKPKSHVFTGVIDSIDAAANAVAVKNKGGECKSFSVTEKTKYATADKPEAALADLKQGDKVSVAYSEDGGKNVAKKIGPPAVPKKKEEKK
jgi:Cu/Ag efflux protein CusF